MQHFSHEEQVKINMGSFELAHRLFLTENFLSLSLSLPTGAFIIIRDGQKNKI